MDKYTNNITDAIDKLTNVISGEDVDSANIKEAIYNLIPACSSIAGKMNDFEKDITWMQFLSDIRSGNTAKYGIGDLIDDDDVVWRIVHHGTETLEDNSEVNGVWLQSKYCTDESIHFSQRAFYACTDGLEAGSYYITFNATLGNGSIIKANDILAFTLTKDVPVGGRLFIPSMYIGKNTWKVRSIANDGKTVIEEVTPIFTAEGTNLGSTNSNLNLRNENINGIYEMLYGYNIWAASAVRQYLNSEKPAGEWWTPYDKWDVAPDQLDLVNGYLYDKTSGFKSSLCEVKTVTYGNNTTDVEDIVTYDKVIIPSLDQMFIAPQYAGNGEGEAFDYYKELRGSNTPFARQTATPELVIKNKAGVARGVWLRSANRGSSSHEWYVISTGYVNANSAINAYALQPIVFMG